MLRTVVFDMGNVLLHFSHERMCRQIAAVCRSSPDDVRRWLFDDGWELAFERGDIDADEFQRRLEQRSGCVVSRVALAEAASDIFTLNEPIVPVLDALKSQGLRLVLLSNTHVWHVEHVRRQFDVLDRFDHLVLSYEARAVKPEAAIFETAVNALQCPPHEAFYTDDIAKYVDVGRNVGLQAEIFTDAAGLRNHLAARGISIAAE